MSPYHVTITAALFLASVRPANTIAQANVGNRFADSSVAAIMRAVRHGTLPSAAIVAVLRRSTTHSSAARDALGDSISRFVIESSGDTPSAIEAVAISGFTEHGFGGQPSPEALDRLIDISRRARNVRNRCSAILAMLQQDDPMRALPYLAEIATSDRPEDSFTAISQLNAFAFGALQATQNERAAAARLLRRLYDGDSVRAGLGVVVMCDIAKARGWPLKQACRGRA